jgi:hypothetical protein
MMRTTLAVVLGSVLAIGLATRGQQGELPQRDPPKRLKGTVKKVEHDHPTKRHLNLAVMDRQPTAQEDISRAVQRAYRFEVPKSTLVLGHDGKPEERGLGSLKAGERVRSEYRKHQTLEIKRLPAKVNPADRQ